MRALVYTGPETVALRSVPDPVPRPGEVLVKVEAVGICGSDMHAYLGHDERRPAPLILGHEAAGRIAVGSRAGERVTINPLVTCTHCRHCRSGRENLCPDRQILSMPPREGAFAEFVAVPERNVEPVPEAVPSSHAALVEPFACGWHAVRLAESGLSEPLAEAACLVLGGGAIGLGTALALRARGARDVRIVEPQAARREVLAGIGVAPVTARDEDDADLVVDAVGIAATRRAAFARVRPGGVIAHIGLGSGEGGVDARRATLQEITFIGCYTYTPRDFKETATAMFDGRYGALDWADHRSLDAAPEALRELRDGLVAAPKIILEP